MKHHCRECSCQKFVHMITCFTRGTLNHWTLLHFGTAYAASAGYRRGGVGGARGGVGEWRERAQKGRNQCLLTPLRQYLRPFVGELALRGAPPCRTHQRCPRKEKSASVVVALTVAGGELLLQRLGHEEAGNAVLRAARTVRVMPEAAGGAVVEAAVRGRRATVGAGTPIPPGSA